MQKPAGGPRGPPAGMEREGKAQGGGAPARHEARQARRGAERVLRMGQGAYAISIFWTFALFVFLGMFTVSMPSFSWAVRPEVSASFR